MKLDLYIFRDPSNDRIYLTAQPHEHRVIKDHDLVTDVDLYEPDDGDMAELEALGNTDPLRLFGISLEPGEQRRVTLTIGERVPVLAVTDDG